MYVQCIYMCIVCMYIVYTIMDTRDSVQYHASNHSSNKEIKFQKRGRAQEQQLSDASKSEPGVGWFSRQRAKHLQMTNLIGGAPLIFPFHRSNYIVPYQQPMSVMIFVVSLPMWHLILFGQQSPAAPYWRSCAAEGMKSAIADVSYAVLRTDGDLIEV